jgi:hypothetical protein
LEEETVGSVIELLIEWSYEVVATLPKTITQLNFQKGFMQLDSGNCFRISIKVLIAHERMDVFQF